MMGQPLSSLAQDAYILEKLIDASLGGDDNSETASKLLYYFGSAEQAVSRLNSESSRYLGINSQLVSLFSSIRELNLSVLYKRISDDPFPYCKSSVVRFFEAQFPTRETYVVQFFYFSGSVFVGSGTPVKGTINRIDISNRTVFSDALQRNATSVLPVVGIPHGLPRSDELLSWRLDDLGAAGQVLEISLEAARFV